MTTIELTYVGPPRYVGALAQALEKKGVSVNYQRPMERKDLATAMAVVSVTLAATGPVPDIVETVRGFTGRFGGTRVDGLPDEPRQSVRERLKQLEELRTDNLIDEAEYARQRARILADL
jgi:hypothetical protein